MCAHNIIIKQTESCAIFQYLIILFSSSKSRLSCNLSWWCLPKLNPCSHSLGNAHIVNTIFPNACCSLTGCKIHKLGVNWLSFEVIKLPAASRVFCWASKLRVATSTQSATTDGTYDTYFSVCWSIREFVLWSGSSEPVQEGTRHSGGLDWVGLGCECITCLWILPHFGSAVIDLDLLKPFKLQLLVWICKHFVQFPITPWKLRTQRWEVLERIGLS